MTGQNILNVSQSQNIMSAMTSKQAEKTSDTVAGYFDSLLSSGSYNETETKNIVFSSQGQVQKLQSKDTQNINRAKNSPMEQKIMDSKEFLDDSSEQIKEVILDNTDLSEAELEEQMNILGLSYIDLLNPANLTELVSQISQNSNPADMLMDTDFMGILQGINSIGEELLNQMDLGQDSLVEIIETMDLIENASNETISNQEEAFQNMETVIDDYDTVKDSAEVDAAWDSSASTKTYTDTLASTDKSVGDGTGYEGGENEDFSGTASENESAGSKMLGNDFSLNNASNIAENVTETEKTALAGYSSFDVDDIISQIATRGRLEINGTDSTIEMELNPENLGKIYLNVSHSNGSVNAQITATNDAVREALEAQLVDLRENLSQAGIKVDEVEVTVGSHAFEENLSQGFDREKEEAERSMAHSSTRRNISILELDELSGLMSEEEMLVAQMMLENGNSVDFSA